MSKIVMSEIEAADPVREHEDPTRRELVRRLSVQAQRASSGAKRAPWWKRRRTIIPVGIAGALALTGAAVFVPLKLAINDTPVSLDMEIPITYTTDTGVDVSCRYGLYFGDPLARTPADEKLAEFVKSHDWSGIGQRIYREAMSNPFIPGPDDDIQNDSQEVRDGFSFYRAMDLIWEEIPAEMRQDGQSGGGTSDCTGVLR
ncbi:hypothetical protein [Microbacterium sp.]|uniref:hypothetical protein n=1 Tax=Microbacterium sp. TaxID=51671 RepID=UPI0028AF9ED2|nr:hypothetical protein [Microbacterium sp.]